MKYSKAYNVMLAKKLDKEGVIERGFIYCPICGRINEPVKRHGTLNGRWECIYCHHQFLFEHLQPKG